MRSNDFFWGATGVNIFNYTFIQEYFSAILGLEVGDYYHIINNLHYYSEFRSNLEQLANISGVTDPFFDYKYRCDSLFDFNAQLLKLSTWEEKVRKNEIVSLEKFDNDFFDDWAKVLFYKNKKVPVNFSNPILNEIINM
jgi:thymidylate synthase